METQAPSHQGPRLNSASMLDLFYRVLPPLLKPFPPEFGFVASFCEFAS
jgi:hypothetical protein